MFLNHHLTAPTVFHESLCSRRAAVAPWSPQSVRRYLQSAYSGELAWPPPQLRCRHSSSEEGRKEGSHRHENIIRARAPAPSLPKQILRIQRNTHTSGICLGERSATDQPQSFCLPPQAVLILQSCCGKTPSACWFWRLPDWNCSSKPIWKNICSESNGALPRHCQLTMEIVFSCTETFV